MLSKVEIFDGGFGTELQKRGLKAGEIPEELNITNSDIIKEIHLSYEKAGADYVSTNTFGCNRYKLANSKYSLEEVILSAIKNARVCKKAKVMFDMGPLGHLLAPLGQLSFDEAYEAFKEIVLISKDYVDGYILETFADIYEIKAAILAVKENSDKLVYATMTFDETHHTLTGSNPTIVAQVLEGLGVDALGVNCSLGPWELLGIVKEMLSVSHTPIIVQANRGLPRIKNGCTIYDLKLTDFTEAYLKMYELGVAIFGGCCGTDPEFIKAISSLKGKEVLMKENPYYTFLCSSTNLVKIEDVKVCGERLNPTGKKKLKEALANEDYDYLINEAIKQVNAKADLLDLNVGIPKIDEANVMKKAILKLQEVINLPFQIDSSNKDAIEMGCRYSMGIPLINSVNGEYEVMDRIFPIAKKYGCSVLGLTLDSNGVPKTAEERFAIAKRIINYAWDKYQIRRERIIIDTLTLTASAEQALVKETLKALKMVSEEIKVKTALGVSNVSFGLPNRVLLNKTFLTLAMQNGLNMPIINPCEEEMMNAIYAYKVLYGIDKNSEFYIANITNEVKETKPLTLMSIEEMIKLGLKDEIEAKTLELLNDNDPLAIINNKLIPTLNEIGQLFDQKKIFLPQLMMSAEACKKSFDVISNKFPKKESNTRPIIMATVKGDVHDIGKNIVCVILESYGYKVIDLGKDVDTKVIIEAYHKYNPMAIGLSALMTTTVLSMEETIKELKKINGMCKIFVGGAVVTKDIALEINADYYSKDALEFIEILKKENIV
ncbi:MAG: homocysteine S-methyltransferase family protein [Anaeroplasmataceae bacterium]